MKKQYVTSIVAVILAITIGLLAIGCDHEPPPESPPEPPPEPTQWGTFEDEQSDQPEEFDFSTESAQDISQ